MIPNTKVLKSFARLSDMVTQHAKGVFVEEISESLNKELEPMVTALSSTLEQGMKDVASDIAKLSEERDEKARKQLETKIDKGLRNVKTEVSRAVGEEMRASLSDAMETLVTEAKLSEEEKNEIVDFPA